MGKEFKKIEERGNNQNNNQIDKDIKRNEKWNKQDNIQIDKQHDKWNTQCNNQNNEISKGCPFCGSNEFYDWIYTFVICAKCRGLVDQTPFGLKAVISDASIRFPEILSWWENDETCRIVDKYDSDD